MRDYLHSRIRQGWWWFSITTLAIASTALAISITSYINGRN